jgi:F-type H+-transporting ATPase subunit delta
MSQLTTLARPYAKAAFESAVGSNTLQQWSEGLGLLAALLQHEKVATYLSVPSRSGEQQAATLFELCGDALDSSMQNFVQLLANNKRLVLLPEIQVLFEQLKAERERSVDVEVVSAFPLDAAAEAKLRGALLNRLQREVKLSSSVDKSLIGGMIVRAGDLVIDASVRGKLKKLTETMNA